VSEFNQRKKAFFTHLKTSHKDFAEFLVLVGKEFGQPESVEWVEKNKAWRFDNKKQTVIEINRI